MKPVMPVIDQEVKEGGIIYRVKINLILIVEKSSDLTENAAKGTQNDCTLEVSSHHELVKILWKVLWDLITSMN